jgi:hypothetical protein
MRIGVFDPDNSIILKGIGSKVLEAEDGAHCRTDCQYEQQCGGKLIFRFRHSSPGPTTVPHRWE